MIDFAFKVNKGAMRDSGHCLSRQVTAASVSDRDTCIRWLRHTDPDADALMEVFARMPEGEWRAMFERALIEGMRAIPQPPPELQAFFSGLEQVPRWVDRDQCNLGGATFLRCRLGFVALAMVSLPLIYSWPAGNKPLALSGQLMHRASQRLKDTTRYVFAVSQADGLARFSEGFA